MDTQTPGFFVCFAAQGPGQALAPVRYALACIRSADEPHRQITPREQKRLKSALSGAFGSRFHRNWSLIE